MNTYRLNRKFLAALKKNAIYAIRVEDDDVDYAMSSFCDADIDMMIFNTADGRRLTVCHGGVRGELYAPLSEIMKTDILITCHPRQVIFEHMNLRKKYPPELHLMNIVLFVTIYWGWLFVTAKEARSYLPSKNRC